MTKTRRKKANKPDPTPLRDMIDTFDLINHPCRSPDDVHSDVPKYQDGMLTALYMTFKKQYEILEGHAYEDREWTFIPLGGPAPDDSVSNPVRGYMARKPITEPHLIKLMWILVYQYRDKIKSKNTSPYFNYVAWTKYRNENSPMGFFPLYILTPKGRAVYERLADRETGLVGRASDFRGIAAGYFWLTWRLVPEVRKKRTQRWDQKTHRYVDIKHRDTPPPPIHPSFKFTADDYQIIKDRLMDEGLCQDVVVELNKRGDQVKIIIKG